MADSPLSAAFYLIAELCSAKGLSPLNQQPGVVVVEAGDWRITVNGLQQAIGDVPPYHAALEYKGLPAGMLNPYGGIIVRVTGDSEGALIEALRQEILSITGRDLIAELGEPDHG